MGKLGRRPVGKLTHGMHEVDAIGVVRERHGYLSFCPRGEGFLKSIAQQTPGCLGRVEAIWRRGFAAGKPCVDLSTLFAEYEIFLVFSGFIDETAIYAT